MLVLWIVVAVFAYFCYYTFIGKRRGLPPGPIPLPIIGTIHKIILSKDPPQTRIYKWSKAYESPIITTWMGNRPTFLITDYKLLRDVVAGSKTAEIFAGRPRDFILDTITDDGFGLVTADGDRWKEQRRFSMQTLRNFGFGKNLMEQRIVEETQTLVDEIDSRARNEPGIPQSLDHLLQACVGSIITNVILGHRFDANDPRFEKLIKLLDQNFKTITHPLVLLMNQYSWLRHFPPFSAKYQMIVRNKDSFIAFVQEEIEMHKQHFNPAEEPSDFTAAYLKVAKYFFYSLNSVQPKVFNLILTNQTQQLEMHNRAENEEPMGFFSEKQLNFSLCDLWAAGMETTVTTLKWTILFLVNRPTIQDKVYKELSDYYNDRPVSMADKNQLPYTSATIMEAQRLGNLAPINFPHRVTEDIEIAGYLIPKNSVVIPQMSCVHVDPDIFPEPDQFKPERFLENDEKSVKKADELMPFSMGKRVCLGESLARMELFIIFATLFRQLKIRSAEPLTEKAEIGMTLCPKPYKVIVEPR